MMVLDIRKFESDLKNGLDHAEWYESEIKWMISTIKKQLEVHCKIPKKERID
jgi:hypothetical protein